MTLLSNTSALTQRHDEMVRYSRHLDASPGGLIRNWARTWAQCNTRSALSRIAMVINWPGVERPDSANWKESKGSTSRLVRPYMEQWSFWFKKPNSNWIRSLLFCYEIHDVGDKMNMRTNQRQGGPGVSMGEMCQRLRPPQLWPQLLLCHGACLPLEQVIDVWFS